jgi:hypothetical protein
LLPGTVSRVCGNDPTRKCELKNSTDDVVKKLTRGQGVIGLPDSGGWPIGPACGLVDVAMSEHLGRWVLAIDAGRRKKRAYQKLLAPAPASGLVGITMSEHLGRRVLAVSRPGGCAAAREQDRF